MAVVSVPVKAVQSLATIPIPIVSCPLFKVPEQMGTYSKVDNSSSSAVLHIGWTMAPLLVTRE